MKTKYIVSLVSIIFLLFLFGSCSEPLTPVDEMQSLGDSELKKGTPKKTVVLTQDEIDGILFMREEEKLAHDVYVNLYEMYGNQIFFNIAESEQKHTEAVLRLIEFYGLTDPAKEGIGEFTNPDLDELYDLLMAMGDDGLTQAMEVGVLIEEKDIEDITLLMEQTEVKNILQVYNHLLNGSLNHLKSFESNLDKLDK